LIADTPEVKLTLSFEEFKKRVYDMAALRFTRLASGYTMTLPTGEVVNAAYGRDNIMDLLEEATDVINILGLLFERLSKTGYISPSQFGAFGDGSAAVEDLLLALWRLDNSLSDEYRVETAKRDVTREEANLAHE